MFCMYKLHTSNEHPESGFITSFSGIFGFNFYAIIKTHDLFEMKTVLLKSSLSYPSFTLLVFHPS